MEKPVLVFANPNSGGGTVSLFVDEIKKLSNYYVAILPECEVLWRNIDKSILHNPELKVIIAGGDGTVNWVISLLTDYYGLEDKFFRPPVAIFPSGTGNDLSRALGWGGFVTILDIHELDPFLKKVEEQEKPLNLDLWTVKITREDTDEVIENQMINYFSIGVDAAMAVDFEQCRSKYSFCFCCQCISKAMYLPMGLINMFGKRNLRKYASFSLTDRDQDGDPYDRFLDFQSSEKTLVIQAISSIYGGRDLWRSDEHRSMDDGRFEVVLQGGSLNLGMTHLGVYLGRVSGQGHSASITTTEPCYYQIDGEGKIMNGPATFEINHIGSYPVFLVK